LKLSCCGKFPLIAANKSDKPPLVAMVKSCYRSSQHVILANVLLFNKIAALVGKTVYKFPPRPAIAYAKGMQRIDLIILEDAGFGINAAILSPRTLPCERFGSVLWTRPCKLNAVLAS
jgi:hypothetical protein